MARSLGLISTLYIGPILNYFVTKQYENLKEDWLEAYTTIWGVRDHIFAPITEEFVYRAGVVSILQPYYANDQITKYSPLLFGLAHVHHGWQLYKKEKLPLFSVLVQVLVQLTYTTLFGILACKVYLASEENLWCPIVVHGTCNLIGFPLFDMRLDYPRWFFVYCVFLCFGVYEFWQHL